MKKELIKFILELCCDSDIVCEELHKSENQRDFCEKHCENLNEMCIKRLMYERAFNTQEESKCEK